MSLLPELGFPPSTQLKFQKTPVSLLETEWQRKLDVKKIKNISKRRRIEREESERPPARHLL